MRKRLGALTLVLLATFAVAAPTHGEGALPQLPTAPDGDVAGRQRLVVPAQRTSARAR